MEVNYILLSIYKTAGKDGIIERVHFGVFLRSRFVPLALSSDWIDFANPISELGNAKLRRRNTLENNKGIQLTSLIKKLHIMDWGIELTSF